MTQVRLRFTQRLPRWQLRSLYITGTLVAVSGLAWLVLQLCGVYEDPFSAWRAAQRNIAVLHGVTSLLMIGLVGAMIPVHVRMGLRARRHLRSGLPLLVLMLVLCLTGVALYYVGGEAPRSITSLGHEAIGIGVLVVFCVHIFRSGKDSAQTADDEIG